MSTPVITEKWAGNFDCSVCRRKRLTAEEFSKKALDKHREAGGECPLKCKRCVEQAAANERRAAEERRAAGGGGGDGGGPGEDDAATTRSCATCRTELGAASYTRSQWGRGEGVSRCRSCVESAAAAEAAAPDQRREVAMNEARRDLEEARATGDAVAILRAESVLAALEAERVTGLKPIRIKGGRGGRGRVRGGRTTGRASRGR